MDPDPRQRRCLELADLLTDLAREAYPREPIELSLPVLLQELEDGGMLTDEQARILDHLSRAWDPWDEEGEPAERSAERHLALGFYNLEREFPDSEIERLLHLVRSRLER